MPRLDEPLHSDIAFGERTTGRRARLDTDRSATVTSVATEDSPEHFGWLAYVVPLDIPTSSSATRDLLGWEPTHPDLGPDLDAGRLLRRLSVEGDRETRP